MTTETADEARARAASTYNAAADAFDDVQNTFWDRFGRRTVARLDLRPGARVLDVCCGTGASALPAAAKVGAGGFVIGVDLAERLLERARVKARHRGLSNVEFRTGDMLALDFASAQFDAVVCVFGIFFVPDMPEAVRELWRLVRPGGQLAITTWGPRFFEPANSVFWNAVRDVRPDLYMGFHPWDRITDPDALRCIFPDTGIERLDVVAEAVRHPLRSPEDWWTMVLGTGLRGTLEQLETDTQRKIRQANLAFIRESGIDAVEANVVYAVASKSQA
jgi:ubiquinone/menaquinone biosynthesis C-methylase UbiE